MNEIIHISCDYESKKITDLILEMAGLGIFCEYCFIKRYDKNDVAYNECLKRFSNVKDVFKVLSQKSINIIPGYLDYCCLK